MELTSSSICFLANESKIRVHFDFPTEESTESVKEMQTCHV